MKKLLLFSLALSLAFAGFACAQAPSPAPTAEPQAMIPNPIVEVDDASAFASLGLAIDAPENASDVRYSIISDEIAQIQFTYDARAYTFRAAKTAEDISGVYETFDEDVLGLEADGEDWYASVTVKTIDSGKGGALASFQYEDIQYSLYTPDAVTAEIIGDLAVALAEPCCPRPEASAPIEDAAIDSKLEAMRPILDSIVCTIGVRDAAAWNAQDANQVFTALYLMGANFGGTDPRVVQEESTILVPVAAAADWAHAMGASGVPDAIPENLSQSVFNAPEAQAYRMTCSDRGDSETRIDSFEANADGSCSLKLGLYFGDGERLGGMDFVLNANSDAGAYGYTVVTAAAEG